MKNELVTNVIPIPILENDSGRDNYFDYELFSRAQMGEWNALETLCEFIKSNYVFENGMTIIQIAVCRGHVNVVRDIDRRRYAGLNVGLEDKDDNGMTLLHLAVSFGRLGMVKLLTDELYLDVNSKDAVGRSPLHIAVAKCYVDVVEHLVQIEDISLDDVDIAGFTPARVAAAKGDVNIMRLLVGRDAWILNGQDFRYRTVLHIATEKGHDQLIKFILKNSDIVNRRDENLITALHIAVAKWRIDIVRLIVDNGADIRLVNRDYKTPIHLIAGIGRDPVFNTIRFDDDESKQMALDSMAMKGNIDGVRMLVRGFGFNISSTGSRVGNLLHLVSGYRDLDSGDMVKVLIKEFKMNVHGKNKNGETPLHLASKNGCLEAAKILIECGAHVNVKNNDWYTPLDLARANGHQNIASVIENRKFRM